MASVDQYYGQPAQYELFPYLSHWEYEIGSETGTVTSRSVGGEAVEDYSLILSPGITEPLMKAI